MQTKSIFTVLAGKETDYVLKEDDNGETVATCIETGSFLKFPKGADIDALIGAHNEANMDLVPMRPASEE